VGNSTRGEHIIETSDGRGEWWDGKEADSVAIHSVEIWGERVWTFGVFTTQILYIIPTARPFQPTHAPPLFQETGNKR
jgi:hypothetical protein